MNRPAWSHTRAVWTMVLVTLLWSTAGVVSRQLTAAQGFEVTFWRSFFTALSLLVILPLWQGAGVWARMPWRRGAFWLSGACWATMFTAFMVALTLTSVARVLVTLALGPLLTALLARVVTGHRLPGRTWAAIAVAGVGMAWMFGGQMGGAGRAHGGGHQLVGHAAQSGARRTDRPGAGRAAGRRDLQRRHAAAGLAVCGHGA
jgi:drug/metabolite transporter (DMT)-like permease